MATNPKPIETKKDVEVIVMTSPKYSSRCNSVLWCFCLGTIPATEMGSPGLKP